MNRPPVRKRRVFYLSGFDPRGASHYHRLYRHEGRAQSAVNGLKLDISGRRRIAQHVQGWHIKATDPADQVTETAYEFLVWDDIIRRHWATTLPEVLGDLWSFIRAYVLSGLAPGFARTYRKQMLVLFYPVVFMLMAILAALAAAIGGYALISVLPNLPLSIKPPVGILAAVLAGWVVTVWALKIGNRFAVFWLLRIYVFSTRWANGEAPGLDERIVVFASRIVAAVKDGELDEIQVVCHSVGSMLAVPVMARVLDELSAEAGCFAGQRVVLVTLGECIPLMSFQPNAGTYRQALQTLGKHTGLLWVDYSAPTDGACFPLLDPVRASGLEVALEAGPHILSPRFFTLYSPERYKRLRRDWYGMHFLYLMATDYSYGYDFFAMTSGPRSVASLIAKGQ